MKTTNILFVLFTSILLPFNMMGQTEIEILNSIKDAYRNTSDLTYSTLVYYFPNVGSTVAIDSSLIEINQVEDTYTMRVEEIEIVRTEDVNLYLNHIDTVSYTHLTLPTKA